MRIVDPRPHGRQSPGYLDWRLCQYLPLESNGTYATGLSVYCSVLGIHGIVAHGPPNHQIGQRKGRPIYFQLQAGEYLTHFYLFAQHHFCPGPFPLVSTPPILLTFPSKYDQFITSRGRTAFFCPYAMMEHHSLVKYTTIISQQRITGLIGDTLNEDSLIFHSLGASTTRNAPSQPTAPLHTIWNPPISSPYPGSFLYLTSGRLKSISKLQICRIGPRCAGLAITHHDGTIEALGGWDPSTAQNVTEIYNSAEGHLSRLKFYFSDPSSSNPLCKFLTDIVVETKPRGAEDFVWWAESATVSVSTYLVRFSVEFEGFC